MVARNRGRFLAPIALVGTMVAIGLVVRAELHGTSRAPATPLVSSSTSQTSSTPQPPPFYVVQDGDSLSSIAAKTGVPVGQLEALNPNVNPNALQVGERLRLR